MSQRSAAVEASGRSAFQQKVADTFNKLHPVGTEVDYWKFTKQGEPSGRGKTYRPAELMGGHTAVVWIEGCSGAVAVSHVEVVRE